MPNDSRKPAVHSSDHRDDHNDPISGPWLEILDEGDPPPDDPNAVEGEDYVYLQNDATQPTAGSGIGGGDLEPWSLRRGLSKLDSKGHLDLSAFASGSVVVTVPEWMRPTKDFFRHTLVWDGASFQPAAVYFDSTSGDISITFPL